MATRADHDDLAALAGGIVASDAADGHHVDAAEPAAVADLLVPRVGEPDGTRSAPPLREVLRRWGAKPLALLFGLNVLDELDRVAIVVLAPEIRRDLDLSNAALGAIASLGAVAVVTVGIVFAVLVDRGGNRPRIAGLAGAAWGLVVLLTALVRNGGQLAIMRMLSGIGKASVEPVHGSLLADSYPPDARGRVYGVHAAANPAAAMVGPLIAGVAAYLAGWRLALVVVAIPSIVVGLATLGLRDPARGGHERRALRSGDEGDAGADATDVAAPDDDDEAALPTVPLGTAIRRLNAIQTLRYLYVGIGLLGFGLVAGPVLLSVYFEEQWAVGELGRALIFSVMAVGSTIGFLAGGTIGDRLFRHDPAWPIFLIGAGLVVYSVVTALAVWLPALVLVVAVLTLALVGIGAATASIRQVIAAVSPPSLRGLAFALLGIYIFVYGGFLGGVIFGAIADASSPRIALTLLVIPGTLAGVLMALGTRHVRSDIAMVIADVQAEDAAVAERRAGPASNLLEVRNVDFSYGPVQVLFDVSLDVPEGEIIALLGTNGAGKSTLLRLVTGLDHPSRGTIRLDGREVTYLESEQLLSLGVAQMPGGKAVFPGLTVMENLRVGAFTFRKDTARVDAEIQQVEEWFPVLGERRNQPASTLSGGEQQMLAIGKAFLTRPRLLCIDELSLGLAPAVVSSLLDIVRRMHERGTTIVIVEQSLNVALSLASTAVFMEKGQVRFVGPARDLLERPDLARSVFLEGAART